MFNQSVLCILIQKSSAEEESAAVHVLRSGAYGSSRELNEMTIKEDKINEEVNVAKPEERHAFLPTVTITSPALEKSDSLDQISSSDGEAIFYCKTEFLLCSIEPFA